MEQETYEALVSQVFELFDTGEEAIQYLNAYGLEENRYLLKDLETLCTSAASAIEQLSPQIELKNKLREIGLNAPLTVSRICRTLDAGQMESAYMQYACSLVPLLIFWRRYAEFFLCHAADEEALKAWQESERMRIREIRQAPPSTEDEEEYRFDFSVVVLFYGNQKMTKECLDSIEAYTKNRSYELITFDNGSDPETTAWCESLPHVKKIYYPHNIGSSAAGNLIYSTAPCYMEGKYLLYVSNDVVVTPRYDEILYQCMESDPRIAMAVPVCNSASNLQAIPVPYASGDMQGMLDFAEGHNHCDPRKWADRSRLFTILAALRPQALCQMSLAMDPLFCYDMFADDDFSVTLRRMGFRQVLCKDVFVHHYGSATIGENQFQVMELGRAQFYQKHGVDAWSSLGLELCDGISKFSLSAKGKLRILAIDPLFGGSALALCCRLKECGCSEVMLDALSEDARYLEDMEVYSHRSGLLEDAARVLEGRYDIALVGSNLGRCADLRAVVHTAAGWLKAGGLLITQHENMFSFQTLAAVLQGSTPVNDAFLHDPKESPVLRVIVDGPLESLMAQEGMTLEKSLSLLNNIWQPAVDQILSTLNTQQVDAAKDLLSTIYKFNVWRKLS